MTFPSLRFIDDAGVLADLHDDTGTVNTGVRTFLTAVDLGSATETEIFRGSGPGGSVIRHRPDLVEMRVRVVVLPTTAGDYEAVVAFLGLVGKLLARGGEMDWKAQTTDEIRYIDFEPSPGFAYLRGQDNLADLAQDPEGVEIVILRQPGLRRPEVTLVNAVVVPNDPADTNGKAIAVTVSGDIPVPAKLKITGDAGAAIAAVRVASKRFPTAAIRDDYLAETKFGQCEATGGGWTRTLFNDTASAADANASGGNAAQTTFATVATMARRVKLTRTTKMASLSGWHEIFVRVLATATGTYALRLVLGLRSAGDEGVSPDEVSFVTDINTVNKYFFKSLGRVFIPDDAAGLRAELWARRDSGSGSLRWDYIDPDPVERVSRLSVPSYKHPGGPNIIVPAVGSGESVLSDPEEGQVYALDSAGDQRAVLDVQGLVPLVLEPGESVVTLAYDEGEDKITRDPTATITYSPRVLT